MAEGGERRRPIDALQPQRVDHLRPTVPAPARPAAADRQHRSASDTRSQTAARPAAPAWRADRPRLVSARSAASPAAIRTPGLTGFLCRSPAATAP
jgi:hypothetical protein